MSNGKFLRAGGAIASSYRQPSLKSAAFVRLPVSILFVSLLLIGLFSLPSFAKGIQGLPDFTPLVKANRAAVVNIGTTSKREMPEMEGPRGGPMPGVPDDNALQDFFRKFFGDEGRGGGQPSPETLSSLGSGFIISEDGYVISNYHVVREADEVIVRMSDRKEYVAEIIGTDPRSDIAVLKIEADKPLPALKLGKSANLEVGEWVLAIGSPFGFDHSVTAGIVSAKGRSLPNENYVPFIQTDVAINPGNSGGPLFNLDGEVVGVNSQIYSRTGGFMGLSFAIPIDVVMNVYQQLRDKGSVSRGWLGVLIQDVDRALAESFKMEKPHGALVSKVLEDSPAAKSGIEVGDVIVKFNNVMVGTSSELPPLVGTAIIGDKTPVEVIREGKRKILKVSIGELPTDDAIAASGGMPGKSKLSTNARLGVSVRNLTKDEREQLELPTHGVLIEKVERGPGADAGLGNGDVILQINSKKITNVKELEAEVKNLSPGARVPVLVQRQGSPLFMAIKIPSQAGEK